MYLRFYQLYSINIIISIFIIGLFYSGILVSFTGYLDWEYYIEAFSSELIVNDGFINILNIFKYVFGSISIYAWHIILTSFNIYHLSKIQYFFSKKFGIKYIFVIANPFIYILLSAVGKESLIFAIFFLFISIRKNIFFNSIKIMANLVILYIRPHMLFLIINEYFQYKYTYFISVIFIFFLLNFGAINAEFIYASYDELDILGLKDLPVYLIQSTSDLVLLPINLVIITLSWAFSKSIIINIWGFIYFISLIILIFNKKFPSIDFANIIIFYLIGYSFIVSNSGTGMRVFSFAVYVSLGCIYFKKSILQK